MKTNTLALMLMLSIPAALAACTTSETSPVNPSADACASAYPNNTSPVVGAFIARMERAGHPPELIADLRARAEGSAASAEIEDARARHAIDFLVRSYLGVWMNAAGIAPSAWQGTLPAAEMSPEDAAQASERAFALLIEARAAITPPLWAMAWDAAAQEGRAAILAPVPHVPQAWYAAPMVFRCAYEAALLIAAAAGATSLEEAFAAVAVPSQQVLDASVLEVDALIAIQ